jgi:hypothetical protein
MSNEELRLECLKLAATLTQKPEEVLKLAKQLLEFIKSSEQPSGP